MVSDTPPLNTKDFNEAIEVLLKGDS
jgi:hypothetical protein